MTYFGRPGPGRKKNRLSGRHVAERPKELQMDQAIERIKVPAGAVVKIGGMPFELADDTVVLGTPGNYRLASSQSDTSLGSPYHAAGSPETSITSSRDD